MLCRLWRLHVYVVMFHSHPSEFQFQFRRFTHVDQLIVTNWAFIFFEFHGTLFTLLSLDHLLGFRRTIHSQQWIQKLAVPFRQQKLQKWREISRWSAAQFCKIDPIKGNYITCVSCVAWWIIWSFDADFGFVYVGACVIMQGLTPSWRTSSPLPRLTSLLVFFSAGVKRFIPKQ